MACSIADECHGLGGGILRRAMLPEYEERLGLTATLERSDDAVTELLLPYFGGICHRYGFEQAIADGVCARPRVAFVGVALSDAERADYVSVEQRLVGARHHLRSIREMPLEPFGDFLAAVAHLAERDAGADGRAARDYLDAFSKRRQIVAQSIGKYELLGSLAPAIQGADGALVFTETVRAANHAINRLDPLVSIDVITGSTARRERREILDDLRVRRLDAVAAPKVLDEGIDVPDANLGIVMSASRTRRQMIQRMGRILRRKRAGVAARFVIMFAKDTLEDPAQRDRTRRLPRRDRADLGGDGSVRRRALRRARRVPRRPGAGRPARAGAPRVVRSGRGRRRCPPRRRASTTGRPKRWSSASGLEVAYAFLTFASRGRTDPRPRRESSARLETRLPKPLETAPVPRARARRSPDGREAAGRAEAAVDRAGRARDRPHRTGLADQLHRLRRGVGARRVPLAGLRADGRLPLRVAVAQYRTAFHFRASPHRGVVAASC